MDTVLPNITSHKSLWQEILRKIEPRVQRAMLITWFKDTVILSREGSTIIVGLPLPMFLNWHMEHYKELTLQAAREADPGIEQILYQVDIGLNGSDPRTLNLLGLFPPQKQRKLPGRQEVKIGDELRGKMLNSRYTLDSFVVGTSNRLAHAAGLAVTANPGGRYNPLFVYGGVGLGKTHLLQAIGNETLRTHPQMTVLYTTSEDFTNQVIEAIKHQKMEQLRRRYRQVDMLIVDDIQFFASKERTQEEFFHTFNTLHEARKQIIISSDRPPQELQNMIQDRLRSRFERGMVADVGVPDYETRVAILTERAREYDLFLDQHVIDFIAEHVTDNIRILEGILMQAVALYELEHRMPTVKSIAEILKKLGMDPHRVKEEIGFVLPPRRAVRFEDVLASVSDYYGVSMQEMMGTSRVREVLIPRQVAMYIGRKRLRVSYPRLGELFSGRDHSTVMNAVRKIEALIRNDHQLLREVRAIEEETGVAS